MQPAGWYYYEGDQPGTVRRWNGQEWVGHPTRLPDDNEQARRTLHDPLSPLGTFAAVLSVAGFVLIALLLVQIILVLHDGQDQLPQDYFQENNFFDVDRYTDGLGRWLWILLLTMGLTGVALTTWLNASARTTGALTSDQMRELGDKREFGIGFWLMVLSASPFRLLDAVIPRPQSVRERKRRPGLFSVLNLVAAGASRAGRPSVGPIKIFMWWVLMWLPVVAGLLVAFWLPTLGRNRADSMRTAFQIFEVLLALEVVSLACITATVIAITARVIKPT